jgi:undecaprenyl-phosphate 4-deoxy-4-formamido-L-arabinose transferase
MGLRTVRDIGAFKVFRANLRKAFDSYQGPDVLVDVLLSWATSRFGSVNVDELPRTTGKSNYDLVKLIRVSLLVLTSYTTLPLRLASIMGFLFTFLGLGILIYVADVLRSGSVPGSLSSIVIAVFSGRSSCVGDHENTWPHVRKDRGRQAYTIEYNG